MQCYTELLPPTGVSHALAAAFLSASANNLIIAKTSLLQIFNVVDIKSESDARHASNATSDHQQAKLVLVAEYVLPGVVADIASVKLMGSKSGGDALLVSARNAKLSLIEWDPDTHKISTVSIHYYENDAANLNPWLPDITRCPTHLTVDSSHRCALLHFCRNRVAILPFRQPGDDLAMDDFDAEFGPDHGPDHEDTAEKQKQDESHSNKTPYLPSFVLPLPALDPSLVHPLCLEFLNEYREPTFGILYSQKSPANSLSTERKDVLTYSIVTLDLDKHSSTILVTVSRLPSDLFKIVPLPLPVGGSLLLGANEVIHVDQAGKTNAVGVNEFSRYASAFSMADRSDLEMRLENCVIEHLGTNNGDMLMLLADGSMAILSFKLDGRSVSGMSISTVPQTAGGDLLSGARTCTANIGNNMLFLGSEECDSVLVGASRLSSRPKKTKGDEDDEMTDVSDKDEDEDEDMYEDDLYSSSPKDHGHAGGDTPADGTTGQSYVFRELDRLQTLGPMTDVVLGKPFKANDKEKGSPSTLPELELLAPQGRGAGSLTILRQKLDPKIIESLEVEGARAAWSIHANESTDKVVQPALNYAHYLIIAKSHDEGEVSVAYKLSESGPQVVKASEFNPNYERTIDIGTVANGRRIVQVLSGEIRSYDSTLELSQIYPVFDEDTSEERHAIAVTFSDPYITIVRDDQSILLLQADESGDLDEIPVEGELESMKWLSASLYHDKTQFFMPKSEDHDTTLLFLLGTEGQIYIFNIPHIGKPICIIDGLDLLPTSLPFTTPVRRTSIREDLGELMVADLGDSIQHAPYFILLTALGDLAIYEPFHASTPSSSYSIDTLRLQKISNQSIYDFFGTSQVLAPSSRYSFRMLKSATSVPHVVGLRGDNVHSLHGFHTQTCEGGFVYVDKNSTVRMCQIPPDVSLETSWATRRIPLNEEIMSICYSPAQDVYALGTTQEVGFKLPDDDEIHPEWQTEALTFFPHVQTGSVQLLEPSRWSLIDEYVLEDPAERILCLKCISMEVSEVTGERREMIVAGTAIIKGEDVPTRGCIYVFDVIDVVADPERPWMNRRLKLFAREKVKGAVTSISQVGDQGFILVAQGQKCMVRGLKEDGSLLPVAFMDMQCYVGVVKELKGTGLCIMADALRGLWFSGYSEEPYKLSLFSKDTDNLQVLCADFLPDGKRLYILASDDNCNLHIFQYDPEDPASSNGDRLLHRSSFQTGHFTSTITLLPRAVHVPPSDGADAVEIDTYKHIKASPYQVLVTSTSGQMAAVTSTIRASENGASFIT
ncbi:mRNA cleavage and polyadenylation factor subunit [Ascosphaera pollenicola]|nr:mRNA cleavage and polyadenylation factor subunit [Ascosphaera pollenicola]